MVVLGEKKKKKKKRAAESDLKTIKARKLGVGEFVELETGMQVGEVYLSSIVHRKARFRRMNELQVASLRDSISRLGPRDAVTVIPAKKPGTWELVDGHHRYDELKEQGYDTVPVVVLTDRLGKPVDKATADLAMHSFNISAEIDEENFFKVLEEMRNDDIPIDAIARATARDHDALEELLNPNTSGGFSFGAPIETGGFSFGAGSGSGEEDFSSTGAFGEALEADRPSKESSRGQAILIHLPGTDSVGEMLDLLVAEFDCDTQSDAVLSLMKQHFAGREEDEE